MDQTHSLSSFYLIHYKKIDETKKLLFYFKNYTKKPFDCIINRFYEIQNKKYDKFRHMTGIKAYEYIKFLSLKLA